MRRADRLFQIIQILRRSSRPVTAAALAAELEISQRSVYRDIADLMAQRVPIEGEAGLGYVLDRAFDMPPLMLTPDEIEAAVLGAQWVAGRNDPALARAARDLLAKIEAVVPENLRPFVAEPTLAAPPALDAPIGWPRHCARARLDPRRRASSRSAITMRRVAKRSAPSGPSSSAMPRRCASSAPGASCAPTSAAFAPTGCYPPNFWTNALRAGRRN